MSRTAPPARTAGIVMAVFSALAFSSSGPLVKPLLEAGWSLSAALIVRMGLAGLILSPALVRAMRRERGFVRRHGLSLLAFGLIPVLGCQLLFFSAMQRMPVAVALLIQYLAPVLLVGAVVMALLGATGAMPFAAPPVSVTFRGVEVPGILALLWVGAVGTTLGYALGVMAVPRVGSRLASFIGLSEVLFALGFAWLLLGEAPSAVQIFGGALLLAGVVLVRMDAREADAVGVAADAVLPVPVVPLPADALRPDVVPVDASPVDASALSASRRREPIPGAAGSDSR